MKPKLPWFTTACVVLTILSTLNSVVLAAALAKARVTIAAQTKQLKDDIAALDTSMSQVNAAQLLIGEFQKMTREYTETMRQCEAQLKRAYK